MARKKHILQFKITLKGIKPPIWRRIQVPEDYSFWDFHVAIQSAMDGWLDYHLHLFTVSNPRVPGKVEIGIPDPEWECLASWRTQISDYFGLNQRKALYVYDFGDDWAHDITLELIRPAGAAQDYPVCIAGKRQCPPEDCGGPPGYQRFLEAIQDQSDPEHETYLTWVGGRFDPEEFAASDVLFDDPDQRWRFGFMEDNGGVSEDELILPTRARRLKP